MERGRIRERLRKASQFPITILHGVAGCGKSFALHDALRADPRPHVVFDVAPEQATLSRFVAGFAEALSAHASGVRVAFASAYERAILSAQPAAALAHWLHEHIKDFDLTIVVDNAHHADSPLVQMFLGQLIDRGGSRLRWIIACQSCDYLPVANWLASSRVGLPIEEDELAFTPGEIEELAYERQLSFGAAEALDVFSRTDGWATGVAFLLQTSAARRPYAGQARSFQPIIDYILAECTSAELASLLLVSHLPDLAIELLSALGGNALVRQIEALRSREPFLFVETPAVLRFHGSFRETLRRLSRGGDPLLRASDEERVVEALLELGRYVDVLSFRLGGSVSGLLQVLDQHGIGLLERGELDLVEAAIVRIDKTGTALPAHVIALRAIVESRLGRLDTAEAWFNQAIAISGSDDVRMIEIKYLYACDLLHRQRVDSISLLREHVDDPRISPSLRAGILSALAEALQLDNQPDEARQTLEAALELDRSIGDPELHARVLTRAAYVLHLQEDYPTARSYASTAATIATEACAYTVATGAHSILYVIEANLGNVEAALRHIEHLMESCLKSGNIQFQFYCLATMYEIEVERNNAAAIARIDATLADFDLYLGDLASEEAFLPGDAMRSAARGDFERAYRLLEPSAAHQTTPERVAQRWSEVALYAIGCSRKEDAARAIEQARAALETSAASAARLSRSRLFLALALAFLERESEARRLLDEVNAEADVPQRIREIGEAIGALSDYALGAKNHRAVSVALDVLHARSLGGIARVFESLPSRVALNGSVAP
ncbi:MAG TPA: tetratricopeptide repeat protein [Verrucomicrobiae bacterium]|nr:tetratricopeptide repeat protein [Verrucomicrobiae bacterium]